MARTISEVLVSDDHDLLYCPVCGHPIQFYDLDDECGKIVDLPKCKHVLFIYFEQDVRDFIYTSPTCKEIVADAEKAASEDADLDPVQYTLERIASSSVLCFSMTVVVGGAGLGLVVRVAIEFDPDVSRPGLPEGDTGGQLAGEM